jgi:hypothetical protein
MEVHIANIEQAADKSTLLRARLKALALQAKQYISRHARVFTLIDSLVA